ncbi:uncharacterized protein rbfox3a [Xyrichtys novacula]|uniref:Uncharacterized protein rbfox3a n=1 Tax=Xyrichtys novacula TaxID=13765 RepID=A0AAV1EXQ7_XYRNO|nr:uncharacterized protein rbfox3a [Xyrichtys novacula]
MSEAKGNSYTLESSWKAGYNLRKQTSAGAEEDLEDGNMLGEANVASAIAQQVTEKISALMELKFAKLKSSLDKLSNRIKDNTERIAEAENRIPEGEDLTASTENKLSHRN